MNSMPNRYLASPKVAQALRMNKAVVALESTVVTHGLPRPENIELALAMERVVETHGAVPATIALLAGQVHIGLLPDQLERLASSENVHKISLREFGPAAALGWDGGTTVAGTLLAASRAGIRVFATGGIGGVHLEPANDVSADLPALARYPLIVVCSGAKSILDLAATLEYLETSGVMVLGYQTDEFPAFFSRESGLPVPLRVESSAEIVEIALAHWQTGLESSILVCAPAPMEAAIPRRQVEEAIETALEHARRQGIRGHAVTPFLLEEISRITDKASLAANLALLQNNARVAAQIATALTLRAAQQIAVDF